MNIKSIIKVILAASGITFAQSELKLDEAGQKPDVCVDNEGIVHIVYGKDKSIYYSASEDKGKTFSKSVKVCEIPEKPILAMGRGPQIASGNGKTVIAVIDFKGNVYVLQKDGQRSKWSAPQQVNEVAGKAKEGFCSLANAGNTFYLLWNDTRNNGKNALYGSVSADAGLNWNKNELIYSATDTTGSICPCCKTSLTIDKNGKAYAMWRNQMNGSRDLYFQPFDRSAPAQKLGNGSWKMNVCPMDGGSITITPDNQIISIWRRENSIYICAPHHEEVMIGEGRNPVIAANEAGNIIAWQKFGEIYLITPTQKEAHKIGKGDFPKITITHSGKAILTWEGESGGIYVKQF